MITFHIITLFPESFDSYLGVSIVKRALRDGRIAVRYYNPRDFVLKKDKSVMTYADRRVDDRPYGGGPGMVIEALPMIRAIEKALSVIAANTVTRGKVAKTGKRKSIPRSNIYKSKIIFFSPSGAQFTNGVADKFKKYTDIIMVCGRYEGVDARVKKAFKMADISIGPYTLTGGELPAMVMVDAITRRISGVLGDDLSIEESRVASPDVYTRPEVIEYRGKKYRVPKILLSGHHAKMDEWKSHLRSGEV